MKSKDFKSFEEAKNYAKLNPGSTIVKEIKYVVNLQPTEKNIVQDDSAKNLDLQTFLKSFHELKKLIYETLDLDEIISYGNNNLYRLEASVSQSNYSENDRQNLFDLRQKFNDIQAFHDELEDIQYMQYKEEFNESISKFYSILDSLQELEISKAIQKEIRELIIKSESSMTSSKATQNKAYLDGINKLNINRPNCYKCGDLMQIRTGESKHFWGCTNFPNCWGIKSLNKKELQIIGK